MTILSGGMRHDPLRGFKFRVTLSPPPSLGVGENIVIGCQRVSGLRQETEQVEYRDGDELGSPRKLPGLTTYDNLVIERGQLMPRSAERGAEVLLEWRKLIVDYDNDGTDATEETLRGTARVEVFPRAGGDVRTQGTPSKEYYFDAIWPAIYENSDLDGTASDVWFERLEFAVERAQIEMRTGT